MLAEFTVFLLPKKAINWQYQYLYQYQNTNISAITSALTVLLCVHGIGPLRVVVLCQANRQTERDDRWQNVRQSQLGLMRVTRAPESCQMTQRALENIQNAALNNITYWVGICSTSLVTHSFPRGLLRRSWFNGMILMDK